MPQRDLSPRDPPSLGRAVLTNALLASPFLVFFALTFTHAVHASARWHGALALLDGGGLALAFFSGILALRAYVVSGVVRAVVLGGGLLGFSGVYVWVAVLASTTGGSPVSAYGFAALAVLAVALLAFPTATITSSRGARRRVTGLVVVLAVTLSGCGFLAGQWLTVNGTSPTFADGAGPLAVTLLPDVVGWAALLLLTGAFLRLVNDRHHALEPGRLGLSVAVLLHMQTAFFLLVSPMWSLAWWFARVVGAVGLLLVAWSAVRLLLGAEREAQASTAAEAQADRLSALGTLVGGVAHEINNPLLIVRGNVELALMDVQDAEARLKSGGPVDFTATVDGLQCALESTDRIADITQSLKTVSREEATGREPVDLNHVVTGVRDLIRVGTPRRVTLDVATAPLPVVVTANAAELHQAFFNLVQNGVEAVDADGGRVAVTVTHRDRVAEVRVTDDGPGIPPAERARIFTPFHTTKSGGTGLGLPIVNTIVKDHDGEVLVDSAPGRGTTVLVRFPIAAKTPMEERFEKLL